jgi:hypothetical protein
MLGFIVMEHHPGDHHANNVRACHQETECYHYRCFILLAKPFTGNIRLDIDDEWSAHAAKQLPENYGHETTLVKYDSTFQYEP